MTLPDAGVKVWHVSTPSGSGIGLWIHVTPRAKGPRTGVSGVGGVHGDALRVAVDAPPVEGRANEACARSLGEALGVPRGAIRIDPGARGRRKKVIVIGDPDALTRRVDGLAVGVERADGRTGSS